MGRAGGGGAHRLSEVQEVLRLIERLLPDGTSELGAARPEAIQGGLQSTVP